MTCKVASGAIDKHNSIVNAIFTNLKKARITCDMEVKNPMNNTNQRPGDIYMPEFDVHGDAFFDVSVINCCAESYFKRSSKGQLEGSGIRYTAPHTAYRYVDTGIYTDDIFHTGMLMIVLVLK
jgi:hypothetical protein